MIEIHTSAGYEKLLVYPKSIRIEERALTAEVIDEPGLIPFEALRHAFHADVPAKFRIDDEEVECRVHLSEPRLAPGQVMFRVMELRRLPT